MSEDQTQDPSLVKLLTHLSAVAKATTMVSALIEDEGVTERQLREVDRALRTLFAQKALSTLRQKLKGEDFEVLEQFFRRNLWDECFLLHIHLRTRFISLEILGKLAEEKSLGPEARAAVGKIYHQALDRALAYADEKTALHLMYRLDELQTKSN